MQHRAVRATAWMATLSLAILAAAATPARAQEPGAAPIAGRAEPGEEAPAAPFSFPAAPVLVPAAVVAVPARDHLLPSTDFDARQQPSPRRRTRRGAQIGAVAGAVGGLGFGVLIALMCRIENDNCDVAIPIVTVLGSVGGAVGGAIIGAAIPTEAPAAGAPAPRADRRIGSASVSAGAAHARLKDYGGATLFEGNGVASRANVYAELRPWLALGPEAGMVWFDDDVRIRHISVAVRSTLARGTVSPYVAGDLGAYQVTGPSLEFLGGAIGVGVRWQPTGRAFIDVDARLSSNVQHIDPMRSRAVYIGGGLYW